jgi:hypothetical protein
METTTTIKTHRPPPYLPRYTLNVLLTIDYSTHHLFSSIHRILSVNTLLHQAHGNLSSSAPMDFDPEIEGQTQLDSQPQKGPRLSRNDAKWDSLKDAIHQIYMIEGKTLPETMQLIEERHSFKARWVLL